MKRILMLNAHPFTVSPYSTSIRLMNYTKDQLRLKYECIEYKEIYNMDIPKLDNTQFEIWSKEVAKTPYTMEEQKIINRKKELIQLMKDNDIFVISMPLHNFNVPSKLKDFFDCILEAGETFQYTETGPEGLLDFNKKVLLIQSSGSIYTDNPALMALDYAPQYVKSVFQFMGISNFTLIRAEGTDMMNAKTENIFSNSKIRIDAFISENL